MASTIRTFVAIELAPAVVEEIGRLLTRLSREIDGFRWVDDQQMHITLSFMGDIPESQIPEVCRAVQEATAEHVAFQLGIGGLGAFPSKDRARVAWVGITDGGSELAALQSDIAKNVKPLSMGRDRFKFKPHVTLGRLNRDNPPDSQMSPIIDQNADLPMGESFVSEVVVFSSFLDRTGPTYTAMARYPLKS